MQSPSSRHSVDQELEDTFPASDPPSMSTPSTATKLEGRDEPSADAGWIDLYRVDDANTQASVTAGDIGGNAVLQRNESEIRFGTSAALALLNYLANQGTLTSHVSLIRARAELSRISAAPQIGENPHATGQSFPARTSTVTDAPGRFVVSDLSPADREVLWKLGHEDAGELRVLSNTTFELDPRLLRLVGRGSRA
jgi:hypothetical protein